MKKCNYCGYENPTRVKNPRKCPVCGNPYGATPTRKLTGRYLTWGILVIFALLLAPPVMAISLTFQDPGDFSEQVTCTNTCSWVDNSATCGNSYVYLSGYPGNSGEIKNAVATPMTYSAATLVSQHTYYGNPNGNPIVKLYDSSGNLVGSHEYNSYVGIGRYEMKVIGGSAHFFVNGVENGAAISLSQNPSYVGWTGSAGSFFGGYYYNYDDIIWGGDSKEIFGAPAEGCYMAKDFVNPPSNGLYNIPGTLVSSYNLTATTFGRECTGSSETINLQNYGTGVVVGTYDTGTACYGTINWPISDDVFNNPYALTGFYTTTHGGKYSEPTPYYATGATVAWDQPSYASGDTATITYTVGTGGYWDTTGFSYSVKVVDIYGSEKSSTAITSQTGTVTHAFSSSDNAGVYYAEVVATDKTSGTPYILGYASTDLVAYARFRGEVDDAETTLPIIGANVSIVQGSVISNRITDSTGYNTTEAFLTGATLYINVTAAGYQQYTYSFTPLAAKTINLDFTLVPSSVSTTGVALGGVDRDTPYGRPIPSASVVVSNSTSSESHTTTTNNAGWYLFNSLTNGRCYTITSIKSGYGTNTTFKCVSGV